MPLETVFIVKYGVELAFFSGRLRLVNSLSKIRVFLVFHATTASKD